MCIHFLHTGGYAYLDLRNTANRAGDSAMINSPRRSPPSEGADCLGLWYHIDAVDVGAINVYMISNGTLSGALWSIMGNRDDYWWYAGVTMLTDMPYQVKIHA